MRDLKVSRRELLKRLGMTGAGVLTLSQLSEVLAFQQQARQQVAAPQGALTGPEAVTLAAVCARLIPTDETGPGAAEARASVYIDRSLSGWLSGSRQTYADGLAQIDAAARATHSRSFVELTASEQDSVLAGIEESPFFALVRTHTIQGTFCDPVYGGNANFVGWDLLGYPGIRLNVTAADQRMSQYPLAVRRSAYEYAMFAAAH